MSEASGFVLPPRPESPNESDCCKNDCEMCIFTVYEKKLAEWEKLCRKMKKQEYKRTLDLPSVLSQVKYIPFQLVSIKPLSYDTNIYRFQVSSKDEGESKSDYSFSLNIDMCQHLIMKTKIGSTDCIITRAYTPISNSEEHLQGYFDVLIKVYPEGKMSHYIKMLRVGEVVYWRGPFGNFKYAKNQYEQVIMCCAGTGIAPMFRLIKSIVEDEEEETVVHLLYSCKMYEEVLLYDQISYFNTFWNFSCSVFITRETPQNIRYGETVIQGRISRAFLKTLFCNKPLNRTLVLICGTDSFNNDVKGFVKEVGILANNIHVF